MPTSRFATFLVSVLAAGAALSVLTGCPNSPFVGAVAPGDASEALDAGGALEAAVDVMRVESTCCGNVEKTIFVPTCAVDGCHTSAGGATPQASVDLSLPDVYSRLLGASAGSMGGVLISDAGPDDSILYQVLTPMPAGGYPRMPLTPPSSGYLTASQLACVRTWIDDRGDAGSTCQSDHDAAAVSDAATGCDGTTLTVYNFDSWCSVSVAGADAANVSSQVACVPKGSITLTATPTAGFTLCANPWRGTEGDEGAGDPGKDQGSGASEVSTATFKSAGGTACVSVCCSFPDGGGCVGVDPCAPSAPPAPDASAE